MLGLLTIAVNHKGYGLLANNLAGSLKAFCPEIKRAIIFDATTERTVDKSLFDIGIPVDPQSGFLLKTQVYDLTPFKETLFVDADSLFVSDPSAMLSSLDGKQFAMMEGRRLGKDDQHRARVVWVKLAEAWKAFSLPEDAFYPEYNSSVFYFRKSRETGKYFKRAQENYGAKVNLSERVRREFPDEVAFSAASAQLGFYSDIPGWQPAYTDGPHPLSVSDIKRNFPIVTISGKQEPRGNLRMAYNGTISLIAPQVGIRTQLFNRNLKPQ